MIDGPVEGEGDSSRKSFRKRLVVYGLFLALGVGFLEIPSIFKPGPVLCLGIILLFITLVVLMSRIRVLRYVLYISSAAFLIAGLFNPLFWLYPLLLLFGAAGGSMWGRPLRVNGKAIHPELKIGSGWAHGLEPDTTGLNEETCLALEAIWLHDAKKEHASVPAFSRVSWMLAAAGAPPDLLEGAHQAAIQEVDHARRCFALAAGYGRRMHTVEPMPEMFQAGMESSKKPLATMAVESLEDGCLLEGFNADVAAKCFEACQDPAAKSVLEQIAREERSHAAFSWRVLIWLIGIGGEEVHRAVRWSITTLPDIRRPTAASSANASLVAKADPMKMRAHGRLPDEDWAPLWPSRVTETQRRALLLLEKVQGPKRSDERPAPGEQFLSNAQPGHAADTASTGPRR
jgi:hypothetical protein